jgi:hypothetical protein
MKKIFFTGFVAFTSFHLCAQQEAVMIKKDTIANYNLSSQNGALMTRRDTMADYKPPLLTTFNSARFLSYHGLPINLTQGMEQDIPELTHTFLLTKNTVIQIAQTISYSSPGSATVSSETGFGVWVYIDNEKFATYSYLCTHNSVKSSSGLVLAQLGPGTHTIKIRAGGYSGIGNLAIYGGYPQLSNFTHMSLLFFQEE